MCPRLPIESEQVDGRRLSDMYHSYYPNDRPALQCLGMRVLFRALLSGRHVLTDGPHSLWRPRLRVGPDGASDSRVVQQLRLQLRQR